MTSKRDEILKSGSFTSDTWVRILICVATSALVYKYFPGVENSHYYGGFILKVINPDLLQNDPILGGTSLKDSPYLLTTYYLLPRMFGELWLDDRFVLPFYFGTVLFTFFLVDRICVTLGGTDPFIRAIVIMLFLRDHKLLESEVNLAHQPDFHHSAFAIPLSLLVFWACVSRKPLWVLLASIALLLVTTPQVVPLTAGVAIIVFTWSAESKSARLAGGALTATGVIASIYVFAVYLAPPTGTALELWSILKWDWYEGMVAPFETSFGDSAQILFGVSAVILVCLATIFWPAERLNTLSVARRIVGLAFIIFLLLSLYGHFAPDALKFPQLLIFPITRQFQGVQVLAYIAAAVVLLQWAGNNRQAGRSLFVIAALGFLAIAGPGNNLRWTYLFIASGTVAAAILYISPLRNIVSRISAGKFPGNRRGAIPVLSIALPLMFALVFSIIAIRQLDSWTYLIRHGVHGSSTAAEWREVADWVRKNTAPEAEILPFQYAYTTEAIFSRPRSDTREDKLVVMRSLVSRGGRVVPKPMLFSRGLDLEHMHKTRKQLAIFERIGSAWRAGDSVRVKNELRGLPSMPDYLIVPNAESTRFQVHNVGYSLSDRIGHYSIFGRIGIQPKAHPQ